MVLKVRHAGFARFPIICYHHFKHPVDIIVNGRQGKQEEKWKGHG